MASPSKNTVENPPVAAVLVEKTVVNLTPEEVKLFLEFQKRYAFMELLASVDAFSIKGGSVTIHFDNQGGIGSVDVQRRYRLLQ